MTTKAAPLPCPFCGAAATPMHSSGEWNVWCNRDGTNGIDEGQPCYAMGPSRDTEAEAITAWNTRPAPDMAAVVEAKPQDHWTAKGAIASARALIEAGNKLCLMAETSGGTAGRDDGLVDAINHWAAERDKHKQVLRIIELEGHEPEIGAGYESLSAALQSLRCQQGEYICKCGLRVEPHRCRDTKGDF